MSSAWPANAASSTSVRSTARWLSAATRAASCCLNSGEPASTPTGGPSASTASVNEPIKVKTGRSIDHEWRSVHHRLHACTCADGACVWMRWRNQENYTHSVHFTVRSRAKA